MPSFSTTNVNDLAVASVIMMGTLQKYFSYIFQLICGLPSVTLLGVKEDWMEILNRLEKLAQFGEQPEQFSRLLKPILSYFVRSFDKPEAQDTKDFWLKIAHMSAGGSGPSYLSGWITAFCFWDVDEKSMYIHKGQGPSAPNELEGLSVCRPGCQLVNVLYHKLKRDDIPSGFTSVPVKVDDHGEIYYPNMVARSLAIRAWSSGESLEDSIQYALNEDVIYNNDTMQEKPLPDQNWKPILVAVQAESGWLMYEKKDGAANENSADEDNV